MRNAGRWKPAKRRSAAQRVQLESVHTSRFSSEPSTTCKLQLVAQKENYTPAPTPSRFNNLPSSNPPVPSEDQLITSELRAEDYKRRFRNEVKKATRAKKQNGVLQEKLKAAEAEVFLARTTANSIHVSTSAELVRTQETLARTERSLVQIQDHVASSSKTRNRLSMRLARMPAKTSPNISQPYQLKEKGVIGEETRRIVRDLVQLGVPMENVSNTLETVAQGLGVEIKGHISMRSVGRIVLEGGVAAKLQLVHEIENTQSVYVYNRVKFNMANSDVHIKGLTLSGDGTTHKHINYESRHIALPMPSYSPAMSEAIHPDNFYATPTPHDPSVRFAGISMAPNHTSEEQLKGWDDFIHEIYSLYNDSPLGLRQSADFRNFFLRALTMGTDHANDQKKLKALFQQLKQWYDREVRGEQALQLVSPAELIQLLCKLNEEKIAEAGGQEGWDALSEEEQE
jgi:hypothetical protein